MCARPYSAARTSSPTHRPNPLFVTLNTNLTAYLIVIGKLHYRGAKMSASRDGVEFLFDDPHDLGTQITRVFKARLAEPADPNALFEAQGFLKSEVRRIRTGVANVKPATL